MKNFQDLTVHDYFRILRRRIWYLIIPTLLVSVGAIIYVSRMPSVYKSETTILVSDRLVPEDYIGTLIRQSVMDRIEFARQQIRSRTFVERIAQEFQLSGDASNTEAVVTAVINNTEITVLPPNVFKLAFYSNDPNTAQAVTRRLAERVMQTNNTFRQEKVTGTDQFLDEQLRQATDDLAQAEQKLRDFNQRQFPGAPETVTSDGLATLQIQLAAVDANLQPAMDQRKAYERSLAEHRDLKLAAKAPDAPPPAAERAPAVSAAAPPPAPSSLERQLAAKKAELTELLGRYKAQHPDVLRVNREIRDLESQIAAGPPAKDPVLPQASTAVPQTETTPLPEVDLTVDFYEAEVQRELQQLNRNIARMEGDKRDISNKIAAYGRRINMPANVMQELAGLTRDIEAAKQRQSYLSTKKLSSDLAGKVDTDANNKTFTTIDPPNLPQTPIRPDRRTLTAVGCLAGLMLGIGFIVAREILDPTLSDQDSAAAELKLPILTSIPKVGTTNRRETKLAKKRRKEALVGRKQSLFDATSDQAASKRITEFSIQAAESPIRDVIFGRSNVAREQYQMMRAELAAQRQKGLKSLIVTSAVPDEGKTFISCCLAGILAKEQDKKVLLIDGDLRTGSAGQIMGIENGSYPNGLSEVLTGQADVENCLIPCSDLNLTFLSAGRAVENPVEMLSSPRLQQMMRDLTLLFDWIIVDSPPVLPIADTNLLNPVCDAAIVVVRVDRTPVSLIKETINKVGRERISGIVLNYVRDIKANHYYGHYYMQVAQSQK